LVEVAEVAFASDAIERVSVRMTEQVTVGTHMALIEEMSKPNRPPPIMEMAAMR